jgi:predicted anti-sigma-YlaC factor YlaD
MRCEAFENRLQLLLDERQCPEEDTLLVEHAADCPHCRDVLDTQAGLFDTVRDWSVCNLEVDLVDRVVARATAGLPQESVAAPASRSWWRTAAGRWTTIAVAAALMLMAYKGIDLYGPNLASRFNNSLKPDVGLQDGLESGTPGFQNGPQQEVPQRIELGPFALRAAEDLGTRLALGVHYIHRGQAAMTDVIRGHFPRKPAATTTPGERTSSLLYSAVTSIALS